MLVFESDFIGYVDNNINLTFKER